ncbi:hypothetical protein Tdes44962_MAKER08744 [Teratosphaeria destructans]|uniref:Uncharacterized protein n=1 Tax=Teratosphaeria destructans TaxID=418781 RepID=A0A9W7W416_9PEZI|nr:hypothetical protein Tdes44962_MAKER08744 [Teratosphaeria destructans]
MTLNLPSLTSAIQPPAIGITYARKTKSRYIAFAVVRPKPKAPAVSCVPLGVAPAPLPPAGRGNCMKLEKTVWTP